jgi:hypothetical protein
MLFRGLLLTALRIDCFKENNSNKDNRAATPGTLKYNNLYSLKKFYFNRGYPAKTILLDAYFPASSVNRYCYARTKTKPTQIGF